MTFLKAKAMLIAIVIIAVIGISVGGCQGQPGKPEQFEKVTIGISATSLLASLIRIAEEKGYFLEEGIDVKVKGYPTGKAAMAATFSGEVDMGTVADTPIVSTSDVGYKATFNLVAMNDYIENNPELIRNVIKALVKAEEFASNNRGESIDIIASRLETDREDIDKLWDGYRFKISLSQSLIITLEDVARWSMRNNFTDKTEVPNYLDYIYYDVLEEVKPEAVRIIR